MRGHDDQSDFLFSYVAPEQRVPQDHPLRTVRRLTDAARSAVTGVTVALGGILVQSPLRLGASLWISVASVPSGASQRQRTSMIYDDFQMSDSIGNPMESAGRPLAPGARRFLMNAGRTTKQGQQVSSGKFLDDYKATVSTMQMHPDDMKDIGVASGSTVRVRSLWGEATFTCVEGKTPSGMIFVPYGPPTCRLMGQYTDGTGMPLSKGWEVEVELLEPPPNKGEEH